MKELEITTRVLEPLDTLNDKLLKKGFKIIRTLILEDTYMCPTFLDTELTNDNIKDYLKKSVLIRRFVKNDIEHKLLTYKKKTFDENGLTLNEEKINLSIDDINKAKEIFLNLGFKELITITNHSLVYANNDLELAVQDVKNLGVLIEYEYENDSENLNDDNIKTIKNDMLKKIKDYDINVSNELDVKKAYELIKLKYHL